MLTNTQIEQLMSELKTPEAGRRLVRDILANAPVRELQSRMDGVRTRFISQKMGRALLAESRTVELAAFIMYEHSTAVSHFLAQPCLLDVTLPGLTTGRTRKQHTPDVFVVENGQLFLDEWRMEDRLVRLAGESPQLFRKDADGQWHYTPVEVHCSALGITHRLRSHVELPLLLNANARFLEDYSRETDPLVAQDVVDALLALLAKHKRVPYLQLLYEHKFKADDVLPLVLDGRLHVNLENTKCSDVDNLVIYANPLIARADSMLLTQRERALMGCELELRPGSRFVYDGKVYTVSLVGEREVFVKDESGSTSTLPAELVQRLHKEKVIDGGDGGKTQREYDLERIVANESALQVALERKAALDNPQAADVSDRTMRRWQSKADGIDDVQVLLEALMPARSGNRTSRLPSKAIELAEQATTKGDNKHNRPASPTVASTYVAYVALCEEASVAPMSRTTFYAWMKQNEDVRKREGRRAAYQKAAIPLTFDDDQPVHGVQPHEVVYCDHTPLNLLTKGMRLDNLGKPTLTLMVDGALSMSRAFAVLYRPASSVSVLMCLRDYVRRWGRLPRILVLDNGKEFHSHALMAFCSLFGIDIRWRRRSKPRDSAMVERALGVTEQELISAMDGNTICLKNPRNVSPEVNPDKFITWTLPALHGALDSFYFDVHAKRIHPRLGMSPLDFEARLLREFGSRPNRFVRFDEQFKLMTAPHASVKATRELDRRRGVFVDGIFYWNDKFASSTRKLDIVEVRVELWNASVVYVQYQGNWLVAQARDGSRLEGRFRYELEILQREETRLKRTAAANDRKTPANALKRMRLLEPGLWDERLREQCMEEHLTYLKLGMTEALPPTVNKRAAEYDLGVPRSSDLDLLRSIEKEADAPRVDAPGEQTQMAPSAKGEAAEVTTETAVSAKAEAIEQEAVTDDDFL